MVFIFFLLNSFCFRHNESAEACFTFKCAKTLLLECTWKHLLRSTAVSTQKASEKEANDRAMRVSVLAATLLHNSQAACVSNGRLITHSPPNLSRMQMWLLTCNAIVELPHNALCIYNAPLREFADLIGTLLRITGCMFPPPAACSRTAPSLCRNQKGAGWLRWYRPSPSARAAAPAKCVLMLHFSAVQVMHQQKQWLEETKRQRRHCVG